MSEDRCPVVRVKRADSDSGFMIINESDFVEGMELFEDEPAEPSVPEPDEKADLIKQAEELGIDADRRWSVKRLQAAIDEALKG